jgi:hypothetical protein
MGPEVGSKPVVRLQVVAGKPLQQAAFPSFLLDPVPVDENPETQHGKHGYEEGEHGETSLRVSK